MSDGGAKSNLRIIRDSFRGWAVPGPEPDREMMHEIECGDEETLDALSGHFRIFQLREGHRFSTDDVLCAWYGTAWCPSAGRVLDLGSGIGSVGMIAAWRLRGAEFVTVEAQEISVALAKKSVRYNGLVDRYEIRCGDFREPEILADVEPFELIFGSPPYFPPPDGTPGDHPQKVACRFEVRGDVSDYAEVAARHLAPGGHFCCVFPVEPVSQRQRVFEAADEAGLCVLRWRPVVLQEGKDYALGVFIMVKKEDVPPGVRESTVEEAPLVIRREDGSIHREYKTVKMSVGFPP